MPPPPDPPAAGPSRVGEGPPPDFAAAVEARRRALRALLAAEFAAPHPRRMLEIGCGHGHFLAAYAAAFPATDCTGIDLQTGRLERAGQKAGRGALGNVRLLRAEASEFLAELPPAVAFGEVYILFPDPWPKQRHHKHRLIQPAFLALLAAHVPAGGAAFFRSDDFAYVEWARERFAADPAWRVEPDWPWPADHRTVFQSRALAWRSFAAVRRD